MKGFTLIELLIVVAIIGILAAVAMPGYIGIQERSRSAACIRSAEAAVSDIAAWLNAAKNTSLSREIDTNGNSSIDASDATNSAIAQSYAIRDALCVSYISARWAVFSEYSPWSPTSSLWAVNSGSPNQISCSHPPSSSISLVVQDDDGKELYRKSISTD